MVGDGGGDAVEGAVWSGRVVELNEGVELVLERGDRVGWVEGGEVALQCLLEAFDLAAGGGVVRGGVLVGDAEIGEEGLEAVASSADAGEAGGVDEAVVGEHRCRNAVCFGCCGELGDDDRGCDPGVGGDGEGVAGVVVEEGEDLDVGAIGETPVGHVGLPGLVRLVGLEADVAALRSLLRLLGDDAGGAEPSPDRRGRHLHVVVVLEVPRDGVGTRVQALGEQLLALGEDQLDGLVAELARRVLRAS